MYSVSAYGHMMASPTRMTAYWEALRRVVKSGSVVLDIGTGTGIFALLACQLGARRAFAIEPSNAIEVARRSAEANGYGHRIEFFQDLSTQVSLPEPVDVIVSDLRGALPLYSKHVLAIIDARTRLLAPDGVLIPQRDALQVAVVESPEYVRQHVEPHCDNAFGLDLGAAMPFVTNTQLRADLDSERLLAEPECWAELDYASIESANVAGEVTLTATREGTAHGLRVWFDATLVPGASFSALSEPLYGAAFFPFSEPVEVRPGDDISVSLQANLVESDYIWRWNTRVRDRDDPSRVKADFKQSTFFGVPLSAELQKQAGCYVPELSEEGEIDRAILGLMDGKASVDEIARALLGRCDSGVADLKEALARVSKLSRKYARDS